MNRNEELSQPPTVDDRTPSQLQAELTALADQYVTDWNSETTDMADQLLKVGGEFGSEVLQRLNRLPEKHRAGFLQTLGKGPQPPQAARLPVSVEPAGDVGRNVRVPGGTQMTASTRDDETTVFEIPPDSGFEATPASLVDVYAVDPSEDRLTSHHSLADGDGEQLFVGENHQQHALYLGDESLFELDSGGVLEIEASGHIADGFEQAIVWEYYGTTTPSGTGQTDGESGESEIEGWHRLPTVDTAEESLRSRVDRLPKRADNDESGYTTRRQLTGEFVETSIEGIESRWLRCRLAEPTAACFRTKIETLSVTTNSPPDCEQSTPDGAFVNDVPLAVDGSEDVEPLGQFPQPASTLYLASDETLTKPGAQARVSFEPPETPHEPADNSPADDSPAADFGALDEPPKLSWEYWNGSGWAGLEVDDGTENLQQAGEIRFIVPEDGESTAISGQQAHWIRGRLVAGSYGDLGATLAAGRDVAPQRPRFGTITIGYDHTGSEVSALLAENNGRFKPWSTADGKPFEPLAADSQTIYFGFDRALRDGPIPLFVPLEETGYPTGFDPGIQWEYCVDPETDSWARLTVDDGTNSLTERGIARLEFSESIDSTERFGTTRHWIRAVVAEDQFDTAVSRGTTDGEGSTPGASKSGSAGEQPSTGPPVRPPPTIEGVYPNTQWADNARTVENEILGSSDGSADQEFECAHGPLLSCELWVDESTALSRADLTELRETDPDRLRVVTDDRGEQTAVWVRWQAVDRLDDGDNRVYRLDRTDGTIQFGDGDRGKIPPQGVDSIRATYRSGGGLAGNVSAGAVETLKTPISLVESVDNPFGGAGGTPIEPTPEVAERTAGEIRSRGRAVTPQDYEQIAANSVRTLARVSCQPNRGPDGDRKPGWVRVIVVPDGDRERPTPSLAVETQLEETLTEAAPARLTNGSDSKLSVCGPSYCPCDIDATLELAGGTASRSQLKDEIDDTLSTFLHPLDGNGGDGWAFGEPPTVESIRRRLQEIPDITGVRALSVRLRVDGERRRLGAVPQQIELPADGLVCNGSHRLTLEVDNES